MTKLAKKPKWEKYRKAIERTGVDNFGHFEFVWDLNGIKASGTRNAIALPSFPLMSVAKSGLVWWQSGLGIQ